MDTPTYQQATSAAGRIYAAACQRLAQQPARQSAEEAHLPGGPSVDELEARIRALQDEARAYYSARQVTSHAA